MSKKFGRDHPHLPNIAPKNGWAEEKLLHGRAGSLHNIIACIQFALAISTIIITCTIGRSIIVVIFGGLISALSVLMFSIEYSDNSTMRSMISRLSRFSRMNRETPSVTADTSQKDSRQPPVCGEALLGLICRPKQREAILGDAAEQFASRRAEGWSRARATLYCYVFPIRDQIWPFLRRVMKKVPVFGRLVG